MLWMSCSKPAPPQTLYRTSNWFYLLCPTHRSFVPPTRDEESETQRKAHAKRVRETRRSTQGVTLDEIKSAEQLVKKKNSTNAAEVSIVNANSGRRPRRRSSLPEGPFIVWMIWVFFFFDFYFGFVLIFFSFFFWFCFQNFEVLVWVSSRRSSKGKYLGWLLSRKRWVICVRLKFYKVKSKLLKTSQNWYLDLGTIEKVLPYFHRLRKCIKLSQSVCPVSKSKMFETHLD